MNQAQLFIVFENIHLNMLFSDKFKYNHKIIIAHADWIKPISIFLKNELYSNNSLIDMSYVDSLQFNDLFKEIFYNNNISIFYYNFYNYFYKNRTSFFFINNYKSINSIDSIYNNANWLERESSEMYGINFLWKNDTRRLLLDYSKLENPLLKTFQIENLNEVFFNFFENQVSYQKNETVEL